MTREQEGEEERKENWYPPIAIVPFLQLYSGGYALSNGILYWSDNYHIRSSTTQWTAVWCVELLDVGRAPNNGTEGSLHHLLTFPPALPPRSDGTRYSTGQYPANSDLYETAVNARDTGCSCSKVMPSYSTITGRVCYMGLLNNRIRSAVHLICARRR